MLHRHTILLSYFFSKTIILGIYYISDVIFLGKTPDPIFSRFHLQGSQPPNPPCHKEGLEPLSKLARRAQALRAIPKP